MHSFRRWYVLILPVLAAAVWLSCAPSRRAAPAPLHMNLDSLRDALLAVAPPDADFPVFEGDEQIVEKTWWGRKTYGMIMPHYMANTTPLHHGKFLARLHVDRNYRGLKADTWTYWVVVDTSDDGSGRFASLWVAAGAPARLRGLKPVTRPHDHPHAKAQWLNQSSAVPWATCTPNECCCEGPECDFAMM